MTKATIAKLALTLGVVVAGGGFLIYSSIGQAQRDLGVDELVGDKLDHWKDKPLKVGGKVVAHTVVEAVVDQTMQRTFVIENEGKLLRVFSQGPKPDTFKEEAKVLATGRLVPAAQRQALADAMCAKLATTASGCPIHADAEQAYVVDATELMAKCPSKYGDSAATTKIDTSYQK